MPDDIKNKEKKSEAGQAPEDLKAKLEEYLAGWQRAKADFINYKKDEMKRFEEIIRYGNDGIILDLISILDNFDLAIATMEARKAPTLPVGAPTPAERDVGVEKGVYLIRTRLADLLKSRGVEPVTLKKGDKFDPSLAEAIAEVESDSPPGTVVEEIETGYKLHDKIIRPARVKISREK